MAKMGRPSKYDKLDLEQVRRVAEAGWSDLRMADFFGVNISNWYKWKLKYEEFRECLKAWKENADSNVERSLFERATGYSHPEDKIFKGSDDNPIVVKTTKHYPPDTSAGIFWLKNRQPERWKDKNETELSGDITVVRKVYGVENEDG